MSVTEIERELLDAHAALIIASEWPEDEVSALRRAVHALRLALRAIEAGEPDADRLRRDGNLRQLCERV